MAVCKSTDCTNKVFYQFSLISDGLATVVAKGSSVNETKVGKADEEKEQREQPKAVTLLWTIESAESIASQSKSGSQAFDCCTVAWIRDRQGRRPSHPHGDLVQSPPGQTRE